jgi:hypothetical protein
MPDEDNAEGESARSVEHRLRRLLGAATTRFEHWRSDMRQLENYKAQHDDLLQGLEMLLQVSRGGGSCFFCYQRGRGGSRCAGLAGSNT